MELTLCNLHWDARQVVKQMADSTCGVVGCEDDFRQCENEKKHNWWLSVKEMQWAPLNFQSWISNVYPTITLPETI